jgi:aspartate/methionine/tyrosine aminotransferase
MANTSPYYEKLAFEQTLESSGNFLSGWQSENPFIDGLFSAVQRRASQMDYRRYLYFDEDESLLTRISDLQFSLDGVRPQRILCGSGSTALIFAFLTYLKHLNITKVYYIPPIYFTVYDALERYGIELIPVSILQPFEEGFSMSLPYGEKSVMLLSNPVWYTGVSLPDNIIDDLKNWQNSTSSFIFIDGSLEYLSWDGSSVEKTSRFDPSFTFRLLCPSKQLAANGYRFAYMLTPNEDYRKLSWIYSNIHGSASVESVAFAYESISLLLKRDPRRLLIDFVKNRYERLMTDRIIESVIKPDCGYFMFGKVNLKISADQAVVDGKFFNQKNFPGYSKINLLSPSLSAINGY